MHAPWQGRPWPSCSPRRGKAAASTPRSCAPAAVSEFWNKRWNLTVSNALRFCFYDPIYEGGSPRPGAAVAVHAWTFAMHSHGPQLVAPQHSRALKMGHRWCQAGSQLSLTAKPCSHL